MPAWTALYGTVRVVPVVRPRTTAHWPNVWATHPVAPDEIADAAATRVAGVEESTRSRRATRFVAAAWSHRAVWIACVVTPGADTCPGPITLGNKARAAVYCVAVIAALSSVPPVRAAAAATAGSFTPVAVTRTYWEEAAQTAAAAVSTRSPDRSTSIPLRAMTSTNVPPADPAATWTVRPLPHTPGDAAFTVRAAAEPESFRIFWAVAAAGPATRATTAWRPPHAKNVSTASDMRMLPTRAPYNAWYSAAE